MIILEGVNWSNDWSVFTEPFDNNLVYQFHYYCWSNPDHLNDISYFLKERERLNAPVWVGETGEKNPSIYFATTQYFETNNIGWAFWPWKKIDNRQVIYSVNPPEGYEKIIHYSHTGEKPSRELAERVFSQLLDSIKVENCKYLEHITRAMLCQVPAKIYAVNYGQEGAGISYQVNDTLKARYYRTNEPVKTLLLSGTDRQSRASEQAILLSEGEWTRYTADALENFTATVSIKAKAGVEGSVFTVSINDRSEGFTLADTLWTELVMENQSFAKGQNTIKSEVNSGKVMLLHFDVQRK